MHVRAYRVIPVTSIRQHVCVSRPLSNGLIKGVILKTALPIFLCRIRYPGVLTVKRGPEQRFRIFGFPALGMASGKTDNLLNAQAAQVEGMREGFRNLEKTLPMHERGSRIVT